MLSNPCLQALTATLLVFGAVPTSTSIESTSSVEDKLPYETVEFRTEDKLKIRANFYAPRKSKKERAPAALLVHDAGSNALSLSSSAEYLQRKGFAVLAIDLRGHGGSQQEACDWSKLDPAARLQTWAFAIRDLEAATEYLRDLDNVHNSNLSMVGLGAGAVLASRYAKRDENARAVALLEPSPSAFGFDMGDDICALGGLPVLVIATESVRTSVTPIQAAATKANDGYNSIKLVIVKPKKEGDLLSDKRVNSELTKFLEAEAMEKR